MNNHLNQNQIDAKLEFLEMHLEALGYIFCRAQIDNGETWTDQVYIEAPEYSTLPSLKAISKFIKLVFDINSVQHRNQLLIDGLTYPWQE
jgi:hypothetical protein